MATFSIVYTKIAAFESAVHGALLVTFDDGREIVFRGGPDGQDSNKLDAVFATGESQRVAGGDLDPNLIVTTQSLGTLSDSKAMAVLQGIRDDIAIPIQQGNIAYVPYSLNPLETVTNSNTVAWLAAKYSGFEFDEGSKPIDPRYGNPILAPGLGNYLPGIDKTYIENNSQKFLDISSIAEYLICKLFGINDAHASTVAPEISPATATLFTASTTATPRRDPLVLDLDGDGIETVGLNPTTPLMFDIDASGVKKSVGWLKGDDGFLVRDVNGNGLIDSGAELFGDATALTAGGKAADGFSALADLDSNHDGQIDNLDSQFANLRIWRDLNQDGISQGNELTSLNAQGIVSLNVAATSHSTQLTNGNQIADLGTYTKTGGETGSLGETAQSGDINLAVDTFHSQFTDHLDTSSVDTLPDMQGAGQVRSLREAASISLELVTLVTQFAAATTRSAQQALLDGLLKAWSATSTMTTTFNGAYAGHDLRVDIQNISGPAYQAWQDKLTILEHFNGRTFNPVPSGSGAVTVNLWTTTQDLLQQSYEALKGSVYQSLALQTRLKSYLDLIGLETAMDAANDSEWRRVG